LSWFKRLAHWIAKARLLGLAIGVVVAAALVALRPGTTEPLVRWTGLVLQLLGIATVIIGIEQTRRLFNHPSLLSLAEAWFRQFPPFKRKIVVGAAAASLGIAGMKARGYVTSNPPPNANLEERVASLERNVGHLNKRIDDAFQELNKTESEQKAALEREKQERVAEDTKIASKLETSGTGGLHISAIGALWLLIGVTLGTGSVEIARWLQ
jgi:tetrahydromethanopterin S-methyltransferase subunit F